MTIGAGIAIAGMWGAVAAMAFAAGRVAVFVAVVAAVVTFFIALLSFLSEDE